MQVAPLVNPARARVHMACMRASTTRTRAGGIAPPGSDLPGGGQLICQYASEGNVIKLRALLNGPYAQAPEDSSARAIRIAQLRTAAQRAMACNQVVALKTLIDFGADLNFTMGNGRLVAVEACAAGRAEIAHVLFDAGVSTEVVNGYGRTALLEASLAGHVDCVDVCLKAGANVNFATKNQGTTAAHLAATNGHMPVLAQLREAGADMTIERLGDGKTALQIQREHVKRQLSNF